MICVPLCRVCCCELHKNCTTTLPLDHLNCPVVSHDLSQFCKARQNLFIIKVFCAIGAFFFLTWGPKLQRSGGFENTFVQTDIIGFLM